MRWPARLVSTTSALLLLACASSPPDPPGQAPSDGRVPGPPPKVQVQVAGPSVSTVFPVPWRVTRPRLELDVRAPEAAARERRHEDGPVREVEMARKRLEGAWSFVYGETIGMAIFNSSGELVFQALGGERVSLTFRVLRAPGAAGSEPGRLQLRTVPDSSTPGPRAGPDPGDTRSRFRAVFKWRSAGQVDLQVPTAGEDWPREFGRDRYRLFRNVEEAIRFLERRERRRSDVPRRHRLD